jgi:hypothetical protein
MIYILALMRFGSFNQRGSYVLLPKMRLIEFIVPVSPSFKTPSVLYLKIDRLSKAGHNKRLDRSAVCTFHLVWDNKVNLQQCARSTERYAQVGGLIVAIFITLLLVPVIYAIFVLDLKLVKCDTVHKEAATDAQTQAAGA